MADIILRQPEPIRLTNASDDDALIDLWLKDRASGTQEGYSADIAEFREYVGVNLRGLRLEELHAYAEFLMQKELKVNTRKRKLSAVKSLLTFGHDVGYLQFNVGKAIRLPKKKDTLAQRLLSEEDILKIITLEPLPRNQIILRVMYVTGGRVSELVGASWGDLQAREEGGQITLFGKGEKTRQVLLPERTWRDLQSLRGEAKDDDPLFVSKKGSRLTRSQMWRIVKDAAKRAGVNWGASPHWLRHAHASHAIERGANMALVRDTLGHGSVAVTNQYVHARPGESSSEKLVIN